MLENTIIECCKNNGRKSKGDNRNPTIQSNDGYEITPFPTRNDGLNN